MRCRILIALTSILITSAAPAGAAHIKCRVLFLESCAPDLCEANKEVAGGALENKFTIDIDASARTLKYCAKGACKTARDLTIRDGNGVKHVEGKIDWDYERGTADAGKPLGRVDVNLHEERFFWRAGYLGHNESQEDEDVLYGDCQ